MDVTPLIDIIFQLVLFFMVSTTFVTSPGIQVDLPRSSAQTIIREKQERQRTRLSFNTGRTNNIKGYLADAAIASGWDIHSKCKCSYCYISRR